MKKLSKAEEKTLDSIAFDLESLVGDIEIAIAEVNALINEKVGPAIFAYNGKLEEAREFVETVTEKMDEYASERSDKWHEGDAGQKFQDWRSHWGEPDLDAIEDGEQFDVPAMDHAEALRSLPMALDENE